MSLTLLKLYHDVRAFIFHEASGKLGFVNGCLKLVFSMDGFSIENVSFQSVSWYSAHEIQLQDVAAHTVRCMRSSLLWSVVPPQASMEITGLSNSAKTTGSLWDTDARSKKYQPLRSLARKTSASSPLGRWGPRTLLVYIFVYGWWRIRRLSEWLEVL